METGLTSQQLIGNLIKVGHKSFGMYVPDGMKVLDQDPNFYAHLVAWNHLKGEVRDSKVALPVIGLRGGSPEEKENAVAHLLLLDPRNLLRASYFHRELTLTRPGAGPLFKDGIVQYLRTREKNVKWWDRTAVQHRVSLKGLYALNHIKPGARAQKVLFQRQYPVGSVFRAIRELGQMAPQEAAGTILNHKIPFLVAMGAVGGPKKSTDLILALLEGMSGNEVITNSNMLVKMGVMDNPALKAAYDAAVERAKKDKRVSGLKAGKAAVLVKDEKVKAKLERVQEDSIDAKGIEGDWLVLGDMSGSMQMAIEKSRMVASFLARAVKGRVHLVFFNTMPKAFAIPAGATLEQINQMTRGIGAGGGTAPGCGLQMLLEKGVEVNGIVIVSDGGENNFPMFSHVYHAYEVKHNYSPNVYLLWVKGADADTLTDRCKDVMPYTKIDANGLDMYAMPNLAKILRAGRYMLFDEIMESKLLTIAEVLT
jgi:hypothetical protein